MLHRQNGLKTALIYNIMIMNDLKFIGIIPARYGSSRFPGKPLAKIGNMTMIERVWRQVMKALDVHCGVGIAHNGIIRLTSDPDEKEYSDTAIFIADYLSQIIGSPSDLHDPDVLETIRCLIGSKMAILDGSGYIATVGQFFNERGLLYSNLYHRGMWGF